MYLESAFKNDDHGYFSKNLFTYTVEIRGQPYFFEKFVTDKAYPVIVPPLISRMQYKFRSQHDESKIRENTVVKAPAGTCGGNYMHLNVKNLFVLTTQCFGNLAWVIKKVVGGIKFDFLLKIPMCFDVKIRVVFLFE